MLNFTSDIAYSIFFVIFAADETRNKTYHSRSITLHDRRVDSDQLHILLVGRHEDDVLCLLRHGCYVDYSHYHLRRRNQRRVRPDHSAQERVGRKEAPREGEKQAISPFHHFNPYLFLASSNRFRRSSSLTCSTTASFSSQGNFNTSCASRRCRA